MEFYQEILNSQSDLKIIRQDKKALYTRARFGPSKITRIPLHLTDTLSLFIAVIIGDGHLKKNKYQIALELCDKPLIEYIKKISKNLFERDFNIKNSKNREGKKPSYYIYMDSKSIYNLMFMVFNIPKGKKSDIVCVPPFIKTAEDNIKFAFLSGIMLAEGGKRRRGYGLSTASKKLWLELIELFKGLGIRVSSDRWEYKKYKKTYYGISFKEEVLFQISRGCRSGQTGLILLDHFGLTKGQA